MENEYSSLYTFIRNNSIFTCLHPSAIHLRMMKYEDAIAKSLHYVVDPIMAFNLQLVYIQYGEISSNDFPISIALYDITIF
jgi:hypothetical protein